MIPSAGTFVHTPRPVKAGKSQIVLVDDHAFFRSVFTRLIARSEDLEMAGETGDPEEARRLVETLRPDLVVMDIMLSGADGIDLTRELVTRYDARVLVLSIHDEDSFAVRAMNVGAKGYVMKSEPFRILLKAIRDVLAGRLHLSAAVKAKLTPPA